MSARGGVPQAARLQPKGGRRTSHDGGSRGLYRDFRIELRSYGDLKNRSAFLYCDHGGQIAWNANQVSGSCIEPYLHREM